MDKNLQEIIRIREDRMIKAFNQNNMQITFVENFEHRVGQKAYRQHLQHQRRASYHPHESAGDKSDGFEIRHRTERYQQSQRERHDERQEEYRTSDAEPRHQMLYNIREFRLHRIRSPSLGYFSTTACPAEPLSAAITASLIVEVSLVYLSASALRMTAT